MKNKTIEVLSNILFSLLMLFAATIVSFCFFYLGNRNIANIAIVYTLALILISLKTSGYRFGIASSLFCVVAVNFFFSYPYFKFNFRLDGYPFTFIGMLAITIITSATTTALKTQQKKAAAHEKKLIEADKEKLRATLLRAVSHDLRTPLTTIIGSSQSYLENYEDLSENDRIELVTNIRDDSQWLLNMVENLLTITRIDNSSSDKVHKSLEVVEEVVSEAIQRIHKRIPNFKVNVTMPNDFLMIPMDATLIEQVLINLMENAYVHSGNPEQIDLFITTQGETITFTVRDYGVGINPDELPYIFEGQRTSSHLADGHKGIGIGLSICKTIIEAHDGTLIAQNHSNGAEFLFTLPTAQEVNTNA